MINVNKEIFIKTVDRMEKAIELLNKSKKI